MAPVRRIVVDVLKPHDPSLVEFTRRVCDSDGVDGVNSTLIELDRDVQNVELVFEGSNIEFDTITETIERLGGTVHSVDGVVCGEYAVEARTAMDG